MLAKLTPVINFTNILRAAFDLISFQQKNTNSEYQREKLCKTLL